MQTAHLIAADEFCMHYHAEVSFIHSLHDSGLVELILINEQHFIQEDDLQKMEKLVRLHYDLNINLEGIETIVHLLDKVESLQQEMAVLRTRLYLYE